MTETPEGFLICHDVPIARTGWQEYLRRELGIEDDPDGAAQVYRSPDEVFSPAAMASFEGKSVTDEHPTSAVRPDNYASYERGTVTNVHKGAGDESDLVLADLVIKDPSLISLIQHGKREVSCGYDCNYEPVEDGKYAQTGIRGNHVAVVAAGRAGPTVAIRDERPQTQRPADERRKPVKIDRNTLIGRMVKVFAADAEPEEVAEATRMLHEEHGDPKADSRTRDDGPTPEPPKPSAEPPKAGDEAATGNETEQRLLALLESMNARLERIEAKGAEPESKDDLESLESELQKDPNGEGSVTIAPEDVPSADGDPGPVTPANERPENPIPGADRAAALNMIKTLRPIIAAFPEPQRKQASDALAKTIRDQLKGTGPGGAYAGIQDAVRRNTAAADAKPSVDPSQLGREWYERYNPHAPKRGAK